MPTCDRKARSAYVRSGLVDNLSSSARYIVGVFYLSMHQWVEKCSKIKQGVGGCLILIAVSTAHRVHFVMCSDS